MQDTRRVYAGIADLAQRGGHVVLGLDRRIYDRDRYLFFPAETRGLVPPFFVQGPRENNRGS